MRGLLKSFVRESRDMYGVTFLSRNVHSLIHLADDWQVYGTSLIPILAFPFENFLGRMKKLVRNAANPIVQVAKRLSEYPVLVGTKPLKTKLGTRDGVVKLINGDFAL